MKAKMIITALLLVGGAHMFAAMKDIPSMRPAEIVKLDYATLSPAEQNSLWFTAMFAGLGRTRDASKQVIKNKFPAIKWQNIEQIAIKAKQSNEIDAGIAQARATVEQPARTPVAPAPAPVKAPTTVGTTPAPSVFQPAKPSVPKQETPVIGSHRPQTPTGQQPTTQGGQAPTTVEKPMSTASAPTEFTDAQKKQIEKGLQEIVLTEGKIKELDPIYELLIVDANRYYRDLISLNDFNEAHKIVEKNKTELVKKLEEVKKEDARLHLLLNQAKNSFAEGKTINPEFKLSFPLLDSYVKLENFVNNVKKTRGLQAAIKEAGILESSLSKEKQKAIAAAISATPASHLPKTVTEPFLAVAAELDKQLAQGRTFDPLFNLAVESYVQLANKQIAIPQTTEQNIKDEIKNWKNIENNMKADLRLVQQVRDEYNNLLGVVQNKITQLGAKVQQPVPNFTAILQAKGLKQAKIDLETYLNELKKIK